MTGIIHIKPRCNLLVSNAKRLSSHSSSFFLPKNFGYWLGPIKPYSDLSLHGSNVALSLIVIKSAYSDLRSSKMVLKQYSNLVKVHILKREYVRESIVMRLFQFNQWSQVKVLSMQLH